MVRVLDQWISDGYPERRGTDSLHPGIEALEGVSAIDAERLRAAGIATLFDLWLASTVVLSNKTGISCPRILKWQKLCDLSRLDGVGLQYAELLVAARVDTVQELSCLEPREVLERIDAVRARRSSPSGRRPSQRTVTQWIKNALTLNFPGAPYTGAADPADDYQERGW